MASVASASPKPKRQGSPPTFTGQILGGMVTPIISAAASAAVNGPKAASTSTAAPAAQTQEIDKILSDLSTPAPVLEEDDDDWDPKDVHKQNVGSHNRWVVHDEVSAKFAAASVAYHDVEKKEYSPVAERIPDLTARKPKSTDKVALKAWFTEMINLTTQAGNAMQKIVDMRQKALTQFAPAMKLSFQGFESGMGNHNDWFANHTKEIETRKASVATWRKKTAQAEKGASYIK